MSKLPPGGNPVSLPLSEIGSEAMLGDLEKSDGLRPAVRGENPRPADGWSWHLSEYEVAYVSEYNVRPMRDETWAGSSASDATLDLEAEGVRAATKVNARVKSSISSRPRRWSALAIVILVVAVGLFAVTVFNLRTIDALNASTHSVNKTWQQ